LGAGTKAGHGRPTLEWVSKKSVWFIMLSYYVVAAINMKLDNVILVHYLYLFSLPYDI
jgi:hypothetical protein